MKKIKINKMALSVATAFLMLTSIVSTVASASGGNEIKLTELCTGRRQHKRKSEP